MTAQPARDPRAEYAERLAARTAEVERLDAAEGRLANLRLALFLLAGAAGWLLWGNAPIWAWLAPAAIAFVALVAAHTRTRRRLTRAEAAVGHYTDALARLEFRFEDVGSPGEEWADPTHPYADHLDLFGRGSLYQLLSGARTSAGRETLARWMLEVASSEEIRLRQGAAHELRDRIDLREDLAALPSASLDALVSEALIAWAGAPPRLSSGLRRTLCLLLAAAAAIAAGAAYWIGLLPLVIVIAAQLVVWWGLRRDVLAVLGEVERPSLTLRLAQGALERLERERFDAQRLSRIEAVFGAGAPPPSERLRSFLRRADALEWRENQMFLPIATLLMWGTNWAYAIERWRSEHGGEIESWIRAVGELEALLDVGRYAFERPGDAFPTIVDGPPTLEARAMGHPLLADCVPNDVTLSAEASLIVVTGSNMSGKSTLLRTIGANIVLAQLGAPVRAVALRLTPVAMGASIHTVDSLKEGASRFYAEIGAIKRAMDLAEAAPPGLFLLDELLHGTNSHDRRIGAESIIRGFLDRGAVGVVTTHDLALASIADELGSRARNAHFEFTLDAGRIRYDYTLQPGVVKTGNALEIMKAAGLDI